MSETRAVIISLPGIDTAESKEVIDSLREIYEAKGIQVFVTNVDAQALTLEMLESIVEQMKKK